MTNPFKGAIARGDNDGYIITKQGVVLGEMRRVNEEDHFSITENGNSIVGNWVLLDQFGQVLVNDQYRNDIAALYEFNFRG